jgi:hypothetical protein
LSCRIEFEIARYRNSKTFLSQRPGSTTPGFVRSLAQNMIDKKNSQFHAHIGYPFFIDGAHRSIRAAARFARMLRCEGVR